MYLQYTVFWRIRRNNEMVFIAIQTGIREKQRNTSIVSLGTLVISYISEKIIISHVLVNG